MLNLTAKEKARLQTIYEKIRALEFDIMNRNFRSSSISGLKKMEKITYDLIHK